MRRSEKSFRNRAKILIAAGLLAFLSLGGTMVLYDGP